MSNFRQNLSVYKGCPGREADLGKCRCKSDEMALLGDSMVSRLILFASESPACAGRNFDCVCTLSLEGNEMKLFKLSNKFANDESGAVTVDWVVLTAALVGIAVTLVSTINGGITTVSSEIADQLSTATDAADQ